MKHYILLSTAEKVLPPGYNKTNSVGTEYSIINTASIKSILFKQIHFFSY